MSLVNKKTINVLMRCQYNLSLFAKNAYSALSNGVAVSMRW